MLKDHIVEEVRRLRESYAARFDFDVDALAAELKAQEAKSALQVVSRPPRRVSPNESGGQ